MRRLNLSLQSFDGAIFAGVVLSARSFCEIIIVGQLNRWPAYILDIYRARDVCYGLFSGVFLIAIFICLPYTKMDDPWEMDNLNNTRVEAELQALLDNWPDEAHKRFKTKLAQWTQDGRTSAPSVGQIFDELRSELQTESTASSAQRSEDDRLVQGKLEFLNTMQETVNDWVPIYKWDGREEENSYEASQETDKFDAMSYVGSSVANSSMSRESTVTQATGRHKRRAGISVG